MPDHSAVARLRRRHRDPVPARLSQRHDYPAAFTGAKEARRDGPTEAAVWAIVANYTGLAAGDGKLGIPYVDRDARLDVKDILRQFAWYKSHGRVKPDIDGERIIDRRFAVPLPAR